MHKAHKTFCLYLQIPPTVNTTLIKSINPIILLFVILLIIPILNGCAAGINRSGYQNTEITNASSTKDCYIPIQKNMSYDKKDVTIVGKIDAYDTGLSADCSETTILNIFKKEACSISADVINITEEQFPNLWSSCYQAKAEFLYFKDRKIAKSLISNMVDQTPQADWKINFEISGSYPVISDSILYIGSADGAVYAIDPATGRIKWRFQTGENLSTKTSGTQIITVPKGTSIADQISAAQNQIEELKNEGKRRVDMTPVIESKTVFIGSGDHSFYAIDAISGKMKWSYMAGSGMVNMNNNEIMLPPALIKNNTVYFLTDEGLHALDTFTGKKKWVFKDIEGRTPFEPIINNNTIFLTSWPYMQTGISMKSSLYAIDANSGKKKWVINVDGGFPTTPIAEKGLVFFINKEESYTKIYAIDATNGKIKWEVSAEHSFWIRKPIIVSDIIYFITDKKILALNMETGHQIWDFNIDGEIVADTKVDNQYLYVVVHPTNKDPVIIDIIKASAKLGPKDTLYTLNLTTGEKKWSHEVNGRGEDIMINKGIIYAGSIDYGYTRNHYLQAIDTSTGKELWTLKGGERESIRLIYGNKVFLTSPTVTYFGSNQVDQGYIYTINAKTGTSN